MGKIKRNPEVVWREEEEARAEIIEAMGRGEDTSMEGTVILVVSGMMHQLNLLGGEIWKLLDGTRDEEAVVDDLMELVDVDRETLEGDVRGFLTDIKARGWIEYE